MNMFYKLLEASSEYGATYVFEELETKVNAAACEGYRLKEKSIQVIREDRGNTQVPLCRVIAVMVKKGKDAKDKKQQDVLKEKKGQRAAKKQKDSNDQKTQQKQQKRKSPKIPR